MVILSGSVGSGVLSGGSIAKPKYMNVRTRCARSDRCLPNCTYTERQPRSSSANSNKRTKLSFDPSGNAAVGTCTNKRPSGYMVASQRTSKSSATSNTNSIPISPASASSGSVNSAMLASDNTGGSFLNPTPLPSVHLVKV